LSTPVADHPPPAVPQKTKPHPGQSTAAPPAPAAAPVAAPAAAQAPSQTQAVRQRQMQKRIAVAAEALTSASDVAVPSVPKTEAARQLIGAAIAGNLLFQGLSLAARQAIVSSMAPQAVAAGEVVIAQGDTDASKYYVVDRGAFEVLLRKDEWGGEERKVHTCGPGRWAKACRVGMLGDERMSVPACVLLPRGCPPQTLSNPALGAPRRPQRVWRAGAALLGAARRHRARGWRGPGVGDGARRVQRHPPHRLPADGRAQAGAG
jgi:hypothetical protein